jgi:hypothetical protein
MNFFGAAIAGYASILIHFIPFVILEFFWASIGLVGVVKATRRLHTK